MCYYTENKMTEANLIFEISEMFKDGYTNVHLYPQCNVVNGICTPKVLTIEQINNIKKKLTDGKFTDMIITESYVGDLVRIETNYNQNISTTYAKKISKGKSLMRLNMIESSASGENIKSDLIIAISLKQIESNQFPNVITGNYQTIKHVSIYDFEMTSLMFSESTLINNISTPFINIKYKPLKSDQKKKLKKEIEFIIKLFE